MNKYRGTILLTYIHTATIILENPFFVSVKNGVSIASLLGIIVYTYIIKGDNIISSTAIESNKNFDLTYIGDFNFCFFDSFRV